MLLKDSLGRKRYEHKYKDGLPNSETPFEEYKSAIDKANLPIRQLAYVVMLYWIGCRRSEPLAIKKEDITEEKDCLLIDIPAYKHGKRGGLIKLPLSLYGVEAILHVWEKTRKGRKLFPFCDYTGYRAVKKLFPNKSPHWLRHNRITKLRKSIDGNRVSMDDVKAWTGIKRDSTIQHYGLKTQAGIHRVAKVLE